MDKKINRTKAVLAAIKRPNKWLADQWDYAVTTVSKWWTSSWQPPIESYINIAQVLEVDLGGLIHPTIKSR